MYKKNASLNEKREAGLEKFVKDRVSQVINQGVGGEGMKQWWKKALMVAAALLLIFIIFYQVESKNTGSRQEGNMSLTGKVIVLDPGHGGPDGGAGGGEVIEKDIALEVAHDLKDYLQQAGALVLMTREKDTDLASEDTKGLSSRKTEDLHHRVEFVEDADPDLLISLHLNAIPSSRWHGAQTFFQPRFEESEQLAKFIQASLRHHLENTTRLAKAIDNVYLLKSVDVPAALVEIGFLSNPTEKELLTKETYQKKMAASIYEGILRYYTKEPVPEK